MALKYVPTQNGVNKTLGADLLSGVTAALTLNNTTAIPNKPGVCVIDRVDTNGNLKSASVREYVAYTGVSGSTLTGLTRNADGSSTDQDHAIGAVVEFLPDVLWAQELLDALDGTDSGVVTLDTPTITTPNLTTPTITSGDIKIPSAGNIQVNSADPKRAFYIPASAMFPRTTTGCAALAQAESSTNKVNYKVLDFDQSTEEYAQFGIPSPKYWDAGTITATFYWTAASGSGDVIWGIQGMSFANDDALDQAFGTAQTVTDTLIATGDVHVTSATSAVTIGGTPTAGDWVHFQIYRDADAGGDTLSGDARLIGVRIEFAVGQYNDA